MAKNILMCLLLVAGAPLVDAQSVSAQIPPDEAIPGQFDAGDRIHWFTRHSFGLGSQFTSLAVAGIATGHNTPEEYGPHWEGFGKRYGLAVSHHVISGGLEAGFGSLWGEDPRYFRVPERSIGARLFNVVKMTVVTHNSQGREMPAYARFIAIPSTAFMANAWLPDSDNRPSDAASRIGIAFSGRLMGNAAREFWPDLRRHLPHRQTKSSDPDTLSSLR